MNCNKLMKSIVLWVDDMRNPHSDVWNSVASNKKFVDEDSSIVWLCNYNEFVNWLNITINDKEVLWPTLICFDHDLGEEKTGMDCAKYLVEFCMNNNMKLPNYTCHSSNPVGRENILSYLNSYKKSIEQ